jgi:Spy/CpxP family protein refolding chaperone
VKRILAVSGVLGLLVLLSGARDASAQAPPDPGAERGPGGGEAVRMIDAYVISNLQESLGLTDDQFAKLVPLVKRLQTERREAMRTRMRAVREMRQLLQSGSATESQVQEKLSVLKELENDDSRRGRQTMESIDAMLSPLQQAKFRVFEAEVGQKLRELMGQMREDRRALGPRRTRPGTPPPAHE